MHSTPEPEPHHRLLHHKLKESFAPIYLTALSVIRALDASGDLATFERPVAPLLVMAVVAIALLIVAHSRLLNGEVGTAPSRVH